MKKFIFLGIILVSAVFSGSAFAQDGKASPQAPEALLLVEDFPYSGALNANGWSVHSGAGTNPIQTTAGLTYAGYPGSGLGNAAQMGNAGGEDVNRGFNVELNANQA